MKTNQLLRSVSSLILPFTILFGLYIILNGDLSSGGGFHGGVLLSTSFLLVHFMKEEHSLHFYEIVKIEKYMFLLLVLLSLFLLMNYDAFHGRWQMQLILMLMNVLIGTKVTIGICGIMLIFIEEGSL